MSQWHSGLSPDHEVVCSIPCDNVEVTLSKILKVTPNAASSIDHLPFHLSGYVVFNLRGKKRCKHSLLIEFYVQNMTNSSIGWTFTNEAIKSINNCHLFPL